MWGEGRGKVLMKVFDCGQLFFLSLGEVLLLVVDCGDGKPWRCRGKVRVLG